MIKCLLIFTSVLGMACIIAYTYFIWYCILKMEKLIELLNKYLFEKGEKLVMKNYYNNDWLKDVGWEFRWVHLKDKKYSVDFIRWEQVISKRYGFIKRLVDNDKIDRKKLEIRPFSDELVYSDSDCTVYRSDTTYEMLLMLLAISDTPINDLINYLK